MNDALYPIVYFGDRSFHIVSEEAPVPPAERTHVWDCERDGEASPANIVKLFEKYDRIVYRIPRYLYGVEEAFAVWSLAFARITAAGGIVADDGGRLLLIRRNDRWDLPKGRLETGEALERCAEREIAEETGVEACVEAPLCATWHAYWFEPTQRWELNRTWWYLLRTTRPAELRPQREEGIERVVWCDRATAAAHLEAAFPTVRRTFEALHALRPALF